jgi:L-threonylcarbamoyladenylate synthase
LAPVSVLEGLLDDAVVTVEVDLYRDSLDELLPEEAAAIPRARPERRLEFRAGRFAFRAIKFVEFREEFGQRHVVRMVINEILQEIIAAFGGPLAAPSANQFGRISPTAPGHVLEELGGLIPLIIDAGLTPHGLESTIVALRNRRIEVLRRGPVTQDQLAEFGEVVVVGATSNPEAPGQLPSHYAPRTQLILVEDATTVDLPPGKRCGLLSWKTKADARFAEVRLLSARRNLTEAATNLFRLLRDLDAFNLDLIVAEQVSEQGLGAAINDRLRRAAQGAAV